MSKQVEKVVTEVPKIITGSIEELGCMIKAHIPLVQVISHDEEKFMDDLYANVCVKQKLQMFIWSVSQGMVPYVPESTLLNPVKASGDWDKSWNPSTAIEQIFKHQIPKTGSDEAKKFSGAVFVMRDFHTVLAQPIPRQLRDVYKHLLQEGKTILCMGGILAHGAGASKPGMEPSLEKQMIVYRWALPTRGEIEVQLRELVAGIANGKSKIRSNYTDDEIYNFSRALQGLTHVEIDNAASICVTELKELNMKRLLQEKKQIIMRSEILEYIESSNQLTDLGGMDSLKEYLLAHSDSHSEDATAFGVDPLKGILLLGVPGSGKSACAKAVGNAWQVPTLRLDIGKVMTGLVGGSEEKMRAVVSQAASVAPCVLWLDEIEKALSGTKSSNFSDGGTLSRVFGTLLTAMEEGLPGVTLIATANDISALPPELIRRFSEVFFVGLPEKEERKEIFKIHLLKKKRDPANFDLDHLSDISHRYTGAELEKSIKEAIAHTYYDGKRDLTTDDIAGAIAMTKPISKVMSEPIKNMEEWARDRARFASSIGAEAAGVGNQKLVSKTGKVMKMSDLDDNVPVAAKKTGKKKPAGRLELAGQDNTPEVVEPVPTVDQKVSE